MRLSGEHSGSSSSCEHGSPTRPPRLTSASVDRVLVADDDPTHCLLLKNVLSKLGLEVEEHSNGESAWAAMQRPDAPHLLIVDWVMPGIDGLELVRRVRTTESLASTYIIMLTGREGRDDLVAGLQAGADDYLSKPAHRDELRARVRNAVRIIELQLSLAGQVRALENALTQVKQLQGLLPICAYCKKVRGDDNYWQQVEAYFATHSDVRFSHGICPSCYEDVVEPQLEALED
jgi:phosphoserine phosphatase RsbU/P